MLYQLSYVGVAGAGWSLLRASVADGSGSLRRGDRPLGHRGHRGQRLLLCELTLQTEGPEELARFYVDCFGLRELSRDPEGVWLAVGENARLGLGRPATKQHGDQGGRHVHFALSLGPGALERVAQRLRACGLEPKGPVEHDGGDRSLYLQDPEGNVVEAWDHFHRDRTVEQLDQQEEPPSRRSSLLEEAPR